MNNPYLQAMRNVDVAARRSRQRDTSEKVPEGYARERYEILRRSPNLLSEFVREAAGVKDPIRIQEHMNQYLSAMGRKYGAE